jgi:tetratricopeptide (TPR) repeat protein
MNRRRIPVLAAAALLAACAAAPPGETEPPPVADAHEAPQAAEQRPPTDADVMYRVFAGETLGTAGDLEKSAAEYVAAALESNDPAIAERATQVAMAAGSWQFAAMAADRWVVLQPDSTEARQTAIRALLLNEDYVGAEHHMMELLRQMQDEPGRAWSIIAVRLAGAQHPRKAWETLERLIAEQGAQANADALLAKSQLAARLGDLAAANALAVAAVSRAPERPELHAWAGRVAVNMRDEQRALQYYREAWRLKPNDRPIALALAELLRRNGEMDEAFQVLAELPDSPANRLARVAFALDAGRREAAQDIYLGFESTAYPDPQDAALHAGQAAEMLGRPGEAIGWYEQVDRGDGALLALLRRAVLMAENGDLREARNLLASTRQHWDRDVQRETFLTETQILLDAGQPEEAWALLSAALESLPEDTQLRYSRALVAVQLDRIDAAEEELRRILENEPGNAAALNALGYTLADRTDRYAEAEELIRAAYALQPEEASIIDSMGWIAYRLGRLEEAAEYLADAWTRDRNPEIAAHLGEVLWRLGRESEAREIWRLGLERGADNAILNETLERFEVEL